MSDIKVKKSSGNQLLDKEGERVLMQMLNESNNRKLHWKPATKDGKNVSCYFILPISFKLESKN